MWAEQSYQSPEVESTRQRLLIRQQQGFVRGEEVGLADLRGGLAGQAAGFHEGQGLGQARRQILVQLALQGVRHAAQRPRMHLVQIGITALGEGTQQVQRGRRLVIGAQHARRVGDTVFGREVRAVDDVAAIAGQFHTVNGLGIGGTGLGELAGHAAHLDHRHGGAIGQHHGHLQQHAEGVADVVGAEFLEAFGAIAALQQERLALGHIGHRASPANTSGG
jgi:hypothetical protein